MEKELICVNCPVGCRLTVTIENDTVTEVTGNSCPRGKAYAETECIRPERILTTTVRLAGRMPSWLSASSHVFVPEMLIVSCITSQTA